MQLLDKLTCCHRTMLNAITRSILNNNPGQASKLSPTLGLMQHQNSITHLANQRGPEAVHMVHDLDLEHCKGRVLDLKRKELIPARVAALRRHQELRALQIQCADQGRAKPLLWQPVSGT